MKERVHMVLAAGKGTRMNLPDGPKVMAGLYDRPILHHIIETLIKLNPDRLILVVGHRKESITGYFEQPNFFNYCIQDNLKGNAESLITGSRATPPNTRNIMVLQGDDSAFYSPATLSELQKIHERLSADVTLLLTSDFSPKTHGRIFEMGDDKKIISCRKLRKDYCVPGLFYTGTVCFKLEFLSKFMSALTRDSSGELTVPQLFDLALTNSKKIFGVLAPQGEWVGINNQEELYIANNLKSIQQGLIKRIK